MKNPFFCDRIDIINFAERQKDTEMDNNYDVIIVGAGAGGLYSAINLPKSMRVLLLSKRELTLCNSALAQGGIAAVYKPNDDSTELHTEDTLIAGGYKNNPEAISVLVNNAAGEIEKILEFGMDFDRNPDGTLHRTLEGGHSRHRIFHHKDSTGFELVRVLYSKVKTMENVTVMENAQLAEMTKTKTGFSLDILKGKERITANTHFCILATGGIGRVYEYTTNSAIATGDGIAAAYELGAKIKNLHLIQFHPTAFNDFSQRECFLISESLRGEGAYLLNCNEERFMHNYDERLELAPRDVVSHAIMEERKKTGSDKFYLDISYKDSAFVKERFPMIYEKLLTEGYNLTSQKIPIYPCQHYLMGGIDVDTYARTSVDGLYAVGECSHTGVHGNNRLASNSLLEALVFSHRAADDIASKNNDVGFEEYKFTRKTEGKILPHGIRTEIRHIMQKSYFVEPEGKESLEAGFRRVSELKSMLENGGYELGVDYIEAHSLATVAYIILKEVTQGEN